MGAGSGRRGDIVPPPQAASAMGLARQRLGILVRMISARVDRRRRSLLVGGIAWGLERDAAARASQTPAAPPLRLDGIAWTPNRRSDGSVYESDYAQLPLMRYVTLTGERSTLVSVAESPPYPSIGGRPGVEGYLEAWCGGAWIPTLPGISSGPNGGHGDSSSAENANYTWNWKTQRIELTARRSAYDTVLKVVPGTNGMVYRRGNPSVAKLIVNNPNEPWQMQGNQPLADGRAGAWHSYRVAWVPPHAGTLIGLKSTVRGWLFVASHATQLLCLDDGECTQLNYKAPAGVPIDYTYCNYLCDVSAAGKVRLFGTRGSSNFVLIDLMQRQTSDWQRIRYEDGKLICPNPDVPSIGVSLPMLSTSIQMERAFRTEVTCSDRRQKFLFFGNKALRIRYGDALDSLDAGRHVGMDGFIDTLSFASDNGIDHQDFVARNYPDQDHGGRRLHQCGVAYDPVTKSLWMQPNTLETSLGLYRITNLDAGVLHVKKHDVRPDYVAANGIYDRFQCAWMGGVLVAGRWSGSKVPPQVIRLT